MGLKIFGLNRTITAIKKMKDRKGKAIQEATSVACHIILEQAKFYCPVDTGALKESGKVVIYGSGTATRGSVEFGTKYAIWVHEKVEARHTPPTCAKFLERAAREKLKACEEATERIVQVR